MQRVFFFVVLAFFLIPGIWRDPPAHARVHADIVDLKVDQDPPNLKVSFRIRRCFSPEMIKAIQSGLPTTFRMFIVVEKPGMPLFRDKIADLILEHTIRYDALHEQYHVRLAEKPGSKLVTSDFKKAKEWMSRVDDLPVMPLWRIPNGKRYELRVKAELSKVRLPFFVRYIFFFVSMWDFETGWSHVTFQK